MKLKHRDEADFRTFCIKTPEKVRGEKKSKTKKKTRFIKMNQTNFEKHEDSSLVGI